MMPKEVRVFFFVMWLPVLVALAAGLAGWLYGAGSALLVVGVGWWYMLRVMRRYVC